MSALIAGLYSLVLSCVQGKVNPQEYLEELLTRISTTPVSQIAALTPWAWARARRKAEAPAG